MRFEIWLTTQGMTVEAFQDAHSWAFAPGCEDSTGRPRTAAEIFAVLGRDRETCVAATDTSTHAETLRRAQGSLPRERITVRCVDATVVHVAAEGRWVLWSDGVLTAVRDLSPATRAHPPWGLAPELADQVDRDWNPHGGIQRIAEALAARLGASRPR